MTAVARDQRPITVRRVLVGFLVAAIGLSSVALPWLFTLLVLGIALSALFELNALCEIKGQPLEYPVAVIGVVGYIGLAAFDQMHKWEGVLLAGITIAAFWIGMYGEQKSYFARTAYTVLAVLYLGKLVSYFVFIRDVPHIGIWLTVFVIVVIALTDTSGMLIGTMIGRTQLTKISPHKTVEGSLGALAVATLAGTVIAVQVPLHFAWWQGAVLGVATSLAAQAGDLVESALKRDAGVKESGSMIQGHGGVLDRFDSYFFGGMAFFGVLHLLGILALP